MALDNNNLNFTPLKLKPTDVKNRLEAERQVMVLLKQYYPYLDVGPGTILYETVVRPAALLFSKSAEGTRDLVTATQTDSPELLDPVALDRLMTKFLETRRVGRSTTGIIRCVFNQPGEYKIVSGTVFAASGSRLYQTTTDFYMNQGVLINGEYVFLADLSVQSLGIGNTYNAKKDEIIRPPAELVSNISRCFFLSDTTDGGVEETNQMYLDRVRGNMTLKNLTTKRGVRSFLLTNFSYRDIEVVKLGSPEMRRDLFSLPSDTGVFEVHRGSMSDIYVRSDPYVVVSGYQPPLGFPYKYRDMSIADDPNALMNGWNSLSVPNIDTGTRGSVKEDLPLRGLTGLHTLTSIIAPAQQLVSDEDFEALHSDNLVKQKWPIVVMAHLSISDDRGEAIIPDVKYAIMRYISDLKSGEYPQIDEIYKTVKAVGVTMVRTPINLDAYYIKDNLVMESFGTGLKRYPPESLLEPIDKDSLAFKATAACPISVRTSMFYINLELIKIDLV